MKKRIESRFVCLFCVMVLAILLMACKSSLTMPTSPLPPVPPGQSILSVRVVDVANLPIFGVNVIIAGPDNHRVITDSSGKVVVQVSYGSYSISIDNNFGYEDYHDTVQVSEPNVNFRAQINRINEVRIIRESIDPPCGTLNVPYVFNAVKFNVEYSVSGGYAFPEFVQVISYLSNDGVSEVPYNGYGGQGIPNLRGITSNTVGLFDSLRGRVSRTKYIINKLVIFNVEVGKITKILGLPDVHDCLLEFQ